MRTEFRRSFVKDLDNLREATIRQRIRRAITQVESAATVAEITGITRLQGEGAYYRIRVGNYRIGLSIESDVVIFVRVLHRREIYRYFP